MATDLPIQFRRIGWRQTRDIINLSRSMLALDLCRKPHSLFALLVNLERRNHNLSFGLYAGGEMVGYMLVYFHPRSLYHQREELIVHIDEYCVAPDYRGRGRDVITQMVREFDLWQPRSGIEAIAAEDALEHWLGIGRVVAHWGYETNVRENDCVRGGHQMGRLRWENLPEKPWKLSTPSKLPKGQLVNEDEFGDVDVICARTQSQLLALRDDIKRIVDQQTPGQGQAVFNLLWQWWRYFGLEEEMNVLVVRRAEQLIAIAPLSWKHAQGSREDLTLSMIGSGSEYSPASFIVAEADRPLAQAALEAYIEQGVEAGDSRYRDVRLADIISQQSDNASAAGIAEQKTGSRWFGLNRRAVDLDQAFKAQLAKAGNSQEAQTSEVGSPAVATKQ